MSNEIHDYSFDTTDQVKVNGKVYKSKSTTDSSLTFLGKVFLTMFIGLLITSAVAIGCAYLFAYLIVTASDVESTLIGIITAIVICGIALLVMSFVLPMMFIRGKHSILIPGIIYTVLMGVLFSFVVLIQNDPKILLMALGLTCGIFALMTLIGFLGKGKLSGIIVAVIGLFAGLAVLSLIYLITRLVNPNSDNMTLYWVISLGYFAVIMLVTIWDMSRIKMLSEQGAEQGNNVILYCAFVIYTDFISILIRLIYYLGIASRK